MDKEEYLNMYNQENNFWWYKTLHNLIISNIRKKKKNHISIFDAGCGTGRLMELLSEFAEVSGMDNSDEAVTLSKKRGLKNVEKGDLNKWVSKKKYDVITSIDVLYHSAIDDDFLILQKFYDSLSKHGILILNLAAFKVLKREHDKIVHTKRRYKKKNVVNDLKKIGFNIENVSYRMPHLFIIIIFQKIIHQFFPVKKITSDIQEIPNWVNSIFSFFGRLENYYLLKGGSIPFGSSLFIVASKNKK